MMRYPNVYISPSPQVYCTCGTVVYEIDTLECSSCGDIMCPDCYTDCSICGKMYCTNCSENKNQCIKCTVEQNLRAYEDKAFLVLGNVRVPIKNSHFMIAKTSHDNARSIRLTIDGKTYKYLYRSLQERKNKRNVFDYFLFFEEVGKMDEMMEIMKKAYDDMVDEYDDYGIL